MIQCVPIFWYLDEYFRMFFLATCIGEPKPRSYLLVTLLQLGISNPIIEGSEYFRSVGHSTSTTQTAFKYINLILPICWD